MRPKAHAHRAGSVLLAMLLLVSMVAAPIGTGTAVAQDSDGETTVTVDCHDAAALLLPRTCYFGEQITEIDSTQGGEEIQLSIHSSAVSEWESAQALNTLHRNYGEDTETIASLEARHAIASAYENGSSAVQADADAQAAIRDYYAQRQVNTLEPLSKQMAQFAHFGNLTNEDHVNDYQVTFSAEQDPDSTNEGINWIASSDRVLTGNLTERNVTLANGTVYSYHVAEGYFEDEDAADDRKQRLVHFYPGIDDWNETTEQYEVPVGDNAWTEGLSQEIDAVNFSGQFDVHPPYPDSSLSYRTTFDYRDWTEIFNSWADQSQTVRNNYEDGFAEDLYAAMDNGTISPSDLRSAEGQVRYMSGDSEVTDERFRFALVNTLDLSSASLENASTMLIEYEGYTNVEWEYEDPENQSTRVQNQTDYVNETYQGMLFSSDVPTGGFAINTSYDTETLNGSQMIHTEDQGDVQMVNGSFTIREMYDSDGNAVESVEWGSPQYSSYNADEFIKYLEEAENERQIIIEMNDSSSGGGFWDDWDGLDGFSGNGVVAGLVIIVVAALATVLLATNVFRS